MELLKHELYKIFSARGVKVLLFILLGINILNFAAELHYNKVDPVKRQQFAKELTGEITRDRAEYARSRITHMNVENAGRSLLNAVPMNEFQMDAYGKLLKIDGAYWDRQQELEKGSATGVSNSFSGRNEKLWRRMMIATANHRFYDTAGWDKIVDYTRNFGAVFMAALILVGLSAVFSNEYSSGMAPILRSSRYGKSRLIQAKLGAAVIYCAGLSVMNSLINLFVQLYIYQPTGFNAPIQSLDAFMYSPYKFTALQYYALQVMLHMTACVAFGLFVLLVSSLSKTRLMTFFFGAAAFVVPFLMDQGMKSPKNLALLLIQFSFSWAMQADKLFTVYNTYDLLEWPVLYPVVSASLLLVFIVAGSCFIHRNFRNYEG